MSQSTIFQKIIEGKIISKILYKDKDVTVFNDIQPKSPVHFLVVPNVIIPSLNEVNKTNKNIVGHMIFIATKVAKLLNINKKGYRIVINCNYHAGQEIPHLHLHVLGGKKLSNHFN